MKTFRYFLPVLIALSWSNLRAQDGMEILRKTDEVTYAAKDQVAKVKLVMTDKKGAEQTREARFCQKGTEMRLFRFTAPASQDGIAFLSQPNDVMYLYLPAYQKERRIATHVKNQAFAGTDFSYDDMESKPMADEYDAKLLDQTPETYILELKPRNTDGSDYSRLVVTVNKGNYYFRQVDYYDLGGKHIKVLKNTRIEKIGNYWTASEIEMTDLVKQHSTKMITSDIKFDTGLTEDDFSVRKLKQF